MEDKGDNGVNKYIGELGFHDCGGDRKRILSEDPLTRRLRQFSRSQTKGRAQGLQSSRQ